MILGTIVENGNALVARLDKISKNSHYELIGILKWIPYVVLKAVIIYNIYIIYINLKQVIKNG